MLIVAAAVSWAGVTPARADRHGLVALGAGPQFSYVPDKVSSIEETPSVQYGLVSRLKLLGITGIETTFQLDQDAGTQGSRHLSPRYQLGVLLNLVPTRYFTLFAVTGTGAHSVTDLWDINGESTSLHLGGGVEVFVERRYTVGMDLRFRVPGPRRVRELMKEERREDSVREAMSFRVWQVNLSAVFYL